MVLFSATIPREILDLAGKYQHRAVTVKVVHRQLTVPGIEQVSYEVSEKGKLDLLSRLIDMYNLRLSLVFCNTKRRVDDLAQKLQRRGYAAEGLHGDLTQGQRDRVMGKFRSGAIEILVATDLAARGIDVENVEAVFNYDVPQDEEYYVHRIGRTGRAGKGGRAFTFVSGSDMYKLREIQRYANVNITPRPPPSATDAEEMRVTLLLNRVKEVADAGGLDHYTHILEQVLRQDYTTLDIAAALLKMRLEEEGAEPGTKGSAPGAARGMVLLRIEGGRNRDLRTKDILGAITGETSVPGSSIGTIDIRDTETFIEVRAEHADAILAMHTKMAIRRHPFRVTRVP
jgi:ATP-dependent RNA helicase DeaD